MADRNPQIRLETHTVFNQPPPFVEIDLFASDIALGEAVDRAGGGAHAARLSAFGRTCGTSATADLAMAANRETPRLAAFDRYGGRIDEVEFHPAYHALVRMGIGAGIANAAWVAPGSGHVLHAALLFLMSEAEPGVCCPMTMTYAAPAALGHAPALAAEWMPKILAGVYDPASRPAAEKSGLTIGMALTEKQGGSDLRANTTHAARNADGTYTLSGHKWFCSAPMSDAFLTLAKTDKGLGCFLVPRWTPDGARNAVHLMRLKDKLGDRANASAEIEYHGAVAFPVGEDGHGVKVILEAVHHTRLDCAVAPAAFMRQALANALWHAAHRSAFGARLIDQPLMRAVLADLVIESEAATALIFRIARSFDEKDSAFARLATPVGKYWINKRVAGFVAEAMEVHGGAGYVEDGVLPRIFRQSPLNSIWEGSGNVISLDILRALARGPEAGEAFIAALDAVRGGPPALHRAVADAKHLIAHPPEEAGARHFAETLGLALQGVVLRETAPDFVSDAFCATRLGDRPGLSYGAGRTKIDVAALLSRAAPRLSCAALRR